MESSWAEGSEHRALVVSVLMVVELVPPTTGEHASIERVVKIKRRYTLLRICQSDRLADAITRLRSEEVLYFDYTRICVMVTNYVMFCH